MFNLIRDTYYNNLSKLIRHKRKKNRPEGIEPPSQEPESYVISITLRTEFLLDNYFSLTDF